MISVISLSRPYSPCSCAVTTVGTVSLAIAVLAKAPTHQSAKFVFTTFVDGTGVDPNDPVGWSQRASPAYVAVIGILMAQYTLTGFDASAHVGHDTFESCLVTISEFDGVDDRRNTKCCYGRTDRDCHCHLRFGLTGWCSDQKILLSVA